jgi:hypothetical protein
MVKVHRRHRAIGKSMILLQLNLHANFALSTGLPTIGFAMLDQSPRISSPERRVNARNSRAEASASTA